METNNFVEMGQEVGQTETEITTEVEDCYEDEYAEGGESCYTYDEYSYEYTPYIDTTNEAEKFLILVGEDRGAQIDINGGSFKHSHFCKGMITYRQAYDIVFDKEPKFLRLSNQLERDSAYT